MPRGPRLNVPGVLHHVIVRVLERWRSLRGYRDRADFAGRVAAFAEAKAWKVYAWGLLPNHVHLLVGTGRPWA